MTYTLNKRLKQMKATVRTLDYLFNNDDLPDDMMMKIAGACKDLNAAISNLEEIITRYESLED